LVTVDISLEILDSQSVIVLVNMEVLSDVIFGSKEIFHSTVVEEEICDGSFHEFSHRDVVLLVKELGDCRVF